MPISLLILGGSGFVGRCAVLEGLVRGYEVTTFNRGRGGWAHPGAEQLHGDRLDVASLTPLGERDWDVVLDTWSGAPAAVRDSSAVLRDRVAHYAYISSRSVYAWPPAPGSDESAAVVEARPDAHDGDYAELKRGAELALAGAFGERALSARAGLILGPYEDVGRLPWWLARMARGGEVMCPGPPELPLQLIDARDLVRFALDAALAGHHGPFNTVSRRGHATMGSLLEACRSAAGAPGTTLTWVAPEAVIAARIAPWTELPVWIPPGDEAAGLHDGDVERAHAAGLRCRPAEETVADTWAWLRGLEQAPLRPDLDQPGLDAERERETLAAWHDA